MKANSMLQEFVQRLGFWTQRGLYIFAIALVLLIVAELLKGHELSAAIQFGFIWSVISTSIFLCTRIYHVSRGKNCPLCNDLPQKSPSEKRQSPAVED